MKILAALIAAMAGGCTFGFGSPYVGQWRAHEAVEFEVCVENDAGGCEETTAVTTQKPSRRFWGVSMSYPMVGIGFQNVDGNSKTSYRIEPNIEFLSGKGRFAYGIRGSLVLEGNSDFIVTTPIMAMGHAGLSERLSFYGGAGYSPYTGLTIDVGEDSATTMTSNALGRVLAGMQIVGSRSQRDSRILYSIEADAMFSNIEGMSYRSWGLTFSIGLFL